MTTPGSGRSSIGVRVRPNADHFIRDLKAQLAARKVTHYVDVGAKTAQASNDVRQWARTTLKNIGAQINVSADMSQATRDVNAWRREINTLGRAAQIKVRADTSAATANVTAWRQAMGRDLTVKVKADRDAVKIRPVVDRAASQAVQRDLDRTVGGKQFKIVPEMDRRAFQSFERSLRDLKKRVKVEVEPDDRSFNSLLQKLNSAGKVKPIKVGVEADVDALEAQVMRMQAQKLARRLKLKMDIDADPDKAQMQMRFLQLEARRRKLQMEVDIDKSSLRRMTETIGSFGKGSAKAVGGLPGFRSLDLGPLTMGKPSGFVGMISNLTLLSGLIPGLVTGVGALSDAFIRLGGAAALIPGAIGAIGASFATLAVGFSGVGSAVSAMFDLWNEGSDQQQRQAKTAVSAQRSYQHAVEDEAKAQRDLSQARQDALDDLRNLNNELRGGVLNEAQAILDAQKARDRYAQGLARGFDSETDRMQGLLDIAKADQNIIDVRERNVQLQQKVNKANQDGIEGSDRVTAALEAQTRASEATADALQAINDAQSQGAMSKFNDALQQLSPNARDFVLAISGMKGEIFDFRNAIQDTIFQGLGPAFTAMFHNLLPVIQPGMQEIAGALNQNFLNLFNLLQTPDMKSFMDRIMGATADTLKELPGLINPLVHGFSELAAIGAEHLPQVVQLMTDLADRFSRFISEHPEEISKFMDEGIDALGKLAETGINLVKIAKDFSDAFRSAFGTDVFTMIANITGKWHEFLSSEEGQNKLKLFMEDARDLFNEWRPVLEKLPELFSKFSDAATGALNLILPLANFFLKILNDVPPAMELFLAAFAFIKFAQIFNTLNTLAGSIKTIYDGLRGVQNAKLPGAPGGEPTRTAPPAPGQPGVRTPTPPGTPEVPGAPGTQPGAGGRLAALGRVLGPLGVVLGVVTAISDQGKRNDIWDEYAKLRNETPEGSPERREIDRKFYESAGIDIGASGPYPELHEQDWQARVGMPGGIRDRWVVKNGKYVDAETGEEIDIPFFASGGFTNWPVQQGVPAILHGKEYVQPADTVSFYGVDAMQAIHQKRVPPAVLGNFAADYTGPAPVDPTPWPWKDYLKDNYGQGWVWHNPMNNYKGGLIRSYDDGGMVWDDMLKRWMAGSSHGAGPAPGPAQPIAYTPTGTPPGPGGNFISSPGTPSPIGYDANGNPTFSVDPSGGVAPEPTQGDLASFNVLGFNVPIPGSAPVATPGWGPGGPPIGLGGVGPDGKAYDIRNFGIGPGPPGSGPGDWANWFTGSWLTKTLSGGFGALTSGIQGFFGTNIEGNELYQGMTQLFSHFQSAPAFSGKMNMSPGNPATNAAVGSNLQTWANMPTNPAYPGVPGQMPVVFDAQGRAVQINLPPGTPLTATTTSKFPGVEQGLQVNTLKTLRAVAAAFPQITKIGGVRADALKWHPNGLALDIMIPGAGGLNDPTPPEGKALGDRIWAWLQANASELGIDMSASLWQVKDHFNHIHVATTGGGFPVGNEQITFPGASMGSAEQITPSTMAGTPGQTGYANIDALAAQLANPQVGMPVYPAAVGSKPSTVGNSGALRLQAAAMYRAAGLPMNEWKDFDQLIQNESSWNPTAKNPGSTAFGLGQFLDTTAKEYGIPYGTTDPNVQLPAIFAYIKNRYHGSPREALAFWNSHVPHWYDQGGWLQPGMSLTVNATGKPELVVPHDRIPHLANGGYLDPRTGVVYPPPGPVTPTPNPRDKSVPVPIPVPPPPPIQQPNKQQGPSTAPQPQPPPPEAVPQQLPPPITPPAPMAPEPHLGTGEAPGPAGQVPSNAVQYGPQQIQPPTPDVGMHVHPALKTGIMSTANTLGSLASNAVNAAAAAGSFGAAGAAGGGAGSFVAGLFQQAGKIAVNIANIPSSFLVGNITGGTTANAYGVTQRGNNPTGGTRVIDASNNQYGDIYTNNLDDYFSRMRRMDDQRAQATLGHWAR